ncbi:hypothetical protein OOU_Y34scaffold00255g79 [Pyricularia oryzae Y34]|uniref:Uncharacterized protein n=2 Tax=Pyricularia oryzae TaxID=318829 RepID=A0AA97P469_PYRO3|nr:hypothetical protein OOU_Y34scaffold00255g79 [Pyricularia oryzae Y34]
MDECCGLARRRRQCRTTAKSCRFRGKRGQLGTQLTFTAPKASAQPKARDRL